MKEKETFQVSHTSILHRRLFIELFAFIWRRIKDFTQITTANYVKVLHQSYLIMSSYQPLFTWSCVATRPREAISTEAISVRVMNGTASSEEDRCDVWL